MDALRLKAGFHGMAAPSVGASADKPSATPARNLPWGFTFRHQLRSLWPGSKMRHEPVNSVNDAVLSDEIKEIDFERMNWNSNFLNSLNLESEKATTVKPEEIENNVEEKGDCSVANEECDVCAINDDEKMEFDRESFSKLLQKVPLAEARLYARLSYLGCLSYSIPQIKPGNLLRNHGLRFVTSSLEKKEKLSPEEQQHKDEPNASADNNNNNNKKVDSSKSNHNNENVCEEMGDVADDLNSNISSSPCEWFVCDDDSTATRFFVIQGSESLASWQANLQFEPIQFEGLDDVLVHRGIYEAAKGVYKQMLPEIQAHLKSHGDDRATFRFTGHSLGGSLSVLVNLMLLIRGEAPRSSLLLPVVTYGAPSIMCGGDRLLRDLRLPRSHVRSITMHRDIVPRAFSCNYPNRVVELLKAVNGNFRNHPCLSKQKMLYSPMGELLILQPDDTFSPGHDLLPPGGGLYLLTGPASDIVAKSENRVRAAQGVFLNSPHPLEILSDRSAYGPEGSIQRDHDMSSYLKSVRNVIRQELDRTRKARRVLWQLVGPPGVNGVVVSRRGKMVMERRGMFGFSGMVGMGRESLNRFSTLVASQHVHFVVVVLGTYCSFIGFDFA